MASPYRIVNTTDAAARLGVPRYQVTRWILAGHLPARRIGRRWWISEAVLDAFAPPDGLATQRADERRSDDSS